MVNFDPQEFSTWDSDNLVGSMQEALQQYSLAAFWLSAMRKRKADAEHEKNIYVGRLYHHLKHEGGYATKYRGGRPTEDGLDHALFEDKSHQKLIENINTLDGIVDQLWGLQKTAERKFEILKEISSMYRASARTAERMGISASS